MGGRSLILLLDLFKEQSVKGRGKTQEVPLLAIQIGGGKLRVEGPLAINHILESVSIRGTHFDEASEFICLLEELEGVLCLIEEAASHEDLASREAPSDSHKLIGEETRLRGGRRGVHLKLQSKHARPGQLAYLRAPLQVWLHQDSPDIQSRARRVCSLSA